MLSPLHIAAAIGLVAATAFITSSLGERAAEPPAPRQFLVGPDGVSHAGISPDGTKLSVRIDGGTFIRDIDSLDLRPLEAVPELARDFAWSPDSSQVAFLRGGRVVVTDVESGTSRELAPVRLRTGQGITWGAAGILGTDQNSGLTLVPVDGGEPRQIARVEQGYLRGAAFMPDGRSIVYTVADFTEDTFAFGKLVVQYGLELDAERTVLIDDPAEVWTSTHYVEAAEVLLVSSIGDNPGIWVFPLSGSRYTPSGPPYRLLENASNVTASRDGTVIYTLGSGRLLDDPFLWVDRAGNIVETVSASRPESRWPSLSPDGTKVVFRGARARGVVYDMWVLELATGRETRITAEPGTGIQGDWLDDERLIYAAGRFRANGETGEPGALAVRLASGLGAAEIVSDEGELRMPVASRDGRFIAYVLDSGEAGGDIHYMSVETGQHRVYVDTAANERLPALSPEGDRIAYVSDASGSNELWVSTFPEYSTPVRLSSGGAGFVRWNPQGEEIFFDDGSGLWAVPIDGATEHGPEAYGAPERLFGERDVGASFDHFSTRGWEVGLDGQRFLVVQRFDPTIKQTAIVIQDFAGWLRRR